MTDTLPVAPADVETVKVKPLIGEMQVMVNWPAVPVGAAHTPTNSPFTPFTSLCASVASVSEG